MSDDLLHRLNKVVGSPYQLCDEAATEIERLWAERDAAERDAWKESTMDNVAVVNRLSVDNERLRAEIERLRKALTEIAQSEGEDWDVCTLGCWWTAEQALKGDDR